MSNFFLNRWRAPLLSLLRIVSAFVFMSHGLQKLFGMFGGFGHPGGTAQLMSLMGLAGVIETFGGLLLLIGLFTQPVAFILSGEMASAYFMGHFPRGFWPILNHGETPALLCFTFLFIAAAGGGSLGIDALRGSPKPVT
jgi:putative oxidoreductase